LHGQPHLLQVLRPALPRPKGQIPALVHPGQRGTAGAADDFVLYYKINIYSIKIPNEALFCRLPCNQKGLLNLSSPFLYIENHSLGEWFKRRLMSIMEKEKLPLLYWECGLPTAQASKGRSFKNERRK